MKCLQILALILVLNSCKEEEISLNFPDQDTTKSTTTRECGNFDLTITDGSQGFYFYITDVRIIPLDKETTGSTTNIFYCHTLKNQIAFEVRTKYRRLNSEDVKAIPNIKSDPIVGEIVNPIKYSSASLKFSNAIYYKGVFIPANTNILNVAKIEVPEFYFPLTISPFVWDNIHLWSNAFNIPNGNYKVIASWETLDNKIIQDTVDVTFSLK